MSAAETFDGQDVERAYDRIKANLHRTPIFTSTILNEKTGKTLFFKCEAFQKTGSFKARGALNAVKRALERRPDLKGVLTHSSGNFGQALAWASRLSGIGSCLIVTPKSTQVVKKEGMLTYGASLFECDAAQRKNECERLGRENGFTIIEPYNDLDIMAGQGTIALELLDQLTSEVHAKADAILVSTGGGGLVSGIATYVKYKYPDVKGKELNQQLKRDSAETDTAYALDTVADGVRVRFIGAKCFHSIKQYCEPTPLTVNDDEIKAATRNIWQYLKVVAEPSSALPLAAVFKYGATALRSCKNIALIICGGNMDVTQIL